VSRRPELPSESLTKTSTFTAAMRTLRTARSGGWMWQTGFIIDASKHWPLIARPPRPSSACVLLPPTARYPAGSAEVTGDQGHGASAASPAQRAGAGSWGRRNCSLERGPPLEQPVRRTVAGASRRLNVLDEGNREGLSIEVDTSIPAAQVIRVLRRRMRSSSGSTAHTARRCLTRACSSRCRRSRVSRTSGSGSTRSGGRTRPLAACRPCTFGRGLSCGTSLLPTCLLGGGAYSGEKTHAVATLFHELRTQDTSSSLGRALHEGALILPPPRYGPTAQAARSRPRGGRGHDVLRRDRRHHRVTYERRRDERRALMPSSWESLGYLSARRSPE
jgi:hypothetical protein